MNTIPSILTNLTQSLTESQQVTARSNIDAMVTTENAANSKLVLTKGTNSSTLSMSTTLFDLTYPLKFTSTTSSTTLGMNVSTFMTKASYDTLQDLLTVKDGSCVSIGPDNKVSKTNTTYSADSTTGLDLTGTTFSLLTASSTQRGGFIIGSGLELTGTGALSAVGIEKTVASGTKSVDSSYNKEYGVYVPTITPVGDTYEVNASINIQTAMHASSSKQLIVDVGTERTDGNSDLSLVITRTNATVGQDETDAIRCAYIDEGKLRDMLTTYAGDIIYLKDGKFEVSTATVGNGTNLFPYFNLTTGFSRTGMDQVGKQCNGMYRDYYGEFAEMNQGVFFGECQNISYKHGYRSYCYRGSDGNMKSGGPAYNSTWDVNEIARAMDGGATSFVFSYYDDYNKLDLSTSSEIIPFPVSYMKVGVPYTITYSMGHYNETSRFDRGESFALGFWIDKIYESSALTPGKKYKHDAVAYYGFMTGCATEEDGNTYYSMHSPFYLQNDDSTLSDRLKYMIPCYFSRHVADGRYNMEYPVYVTPTDTSFISPVLILQPIEKEWLYWDILRASGHDNYVYETRIGPEHSITIMRGFDVNDGDATYMSVYAIGAN